MSDDTVRIPSVADTVRKYVVTGGSGEPAQVRNGVIALCFAGAMVLVVPRLDSNETPALIPIGLVSFLVAATAAHREYQFGGPARLIVAAGLATFGAYVAVFSAVYAASITFGPDPGSAPSDAFWRLPTGILAAAFLALGVLVVILYWVRRPARARDEAALKEDIRAERKARGRAVES